MAQYLHLPIYIKIYKFIRSVDMIIRQFHKEYKYTLGTELRQLVWQMLDEVIVANSLPDNEKSESIGKISLLFDRFKIRLRFSYETGLISRTKFGYIQTEMEEIGKMIGGWKKWAGR